MTYVSVSSTTLGSMRVRIPGVGVGAGAGAEEADGEAEVRLEEQAGARTAATRTNDAQEDLFTKPPEDGETQRRITSRRGRMFPGRLPRIVSLRLLGAPNGYHTLADG
jgi:hypothetical protein